MSLRLVKASHAYKDQIVDMLDEWNAYNNTHHTNHSPTVIFKSYNDFDSYLQYLNNDEPSVGKVPDSTFFCLDDQRDRMVGAINIRHYLNDELRLYGGHIGDGIRPSERRKGYATQMIGLALKQCAKLGIKEVLMVCDKDNIGSVKSIVYNGGILEDEGDHDGTLIQRYWIKLEK